MPDQSIIGSVGTAGQDPDGFRYPWIESVSDDRGICTKRVSRGQTLGAVLETERTLTPGDRVTFSCHGGDPYGRELRWWVHPSGCDRLQSVRGDTAELTWIVQPASVGRKVYVGIGMAADSRYHREGALFDQGYDGWIVFYYRVLPAGSATNAPASDLTPAGRSPAGADSALSAHSDARPYGWAEWEDSWQRFVSRSIGWYRDYP